MTTIAPADAAPIAESPPYRSLPRRDDGFDRYLQRAARPADSEADDRTRRDTGSVDTSGAHSVARRDRERRRAATDAEPRVMPPRSDAPRADARRDNTRRDDTSPTSGPSGDRGPETMHSETMHSDTMHADTGTASGTALTAAASAALASAAGDASTSATTSTGALAAVSSPTAVLPSAAPSAAATGSGARDARSVVAAPIAASTGTSAGAANTAVNTTALDAAAHDGLDAATQDRATSIPDATSAAPTNTSQTAPGQSTSDAHDHVGTTAGPTTIATPLQRTVVGTAPSPRTDATPGSTPNGASPEANNVAAPAPGSTAATSQAGAPEVQVLAASSAPTTIATPGRTPAPADGRTPGAAATGHDAANKVSVLETASPRTGGPTADRSSLTTARRGNESAPPATAAGTNIAEAATSTTATSMSQSTGGPGGAHATNTAGNETAAGSRTHTAAALGALGAATAPALRSEGASVDPTAVATRPAPVAEQVLDAVLPLRDRGDGDYHVKLELRPAELGRVELSVELHDGVLSVHMHADNPRSQELLQHQLDHLRNLLSDRGVRTGTLDVDQHRGQAAGGNDRHGGTDDPSTQRRDRDGATASATASDRVARTVRTRPSSPSPADGRLDLHV